MKEARLHEGLLFMNPPRPFVGGGRGDLDWKRSSDLVNQWKSQAVSFYYLHTTFHKVNHSSKPRLVVSSHVFVESEQEKSIQLKKTKLRVEPGRRAVSEEADCAGSNPGRGDGRAQGPGPGPRLARMHLLSPTGTGTVTGKADLSSTPGAMQTFRGIPPPVIPA